MSREAAMGGKYPNAPANRDDQIRQVIAGFLARRSNGDTVSDAEIVVRFSHLQPELGRQLQLAHLVESAQAQSQSAADAAVTADAEATTPRVGQDSATPSPIAGAQAAKPGSLVGRFELIERLGQGGFATVWKAYDPQLDRWVAVKIPRRADLSASEAELYLREARAASQVQHRHVVRLHEVDRDGDAIYLVSDLIAGQPLDLWAEQQSPTPREVAQLCELITRALGAIHEAGIVHRDLKPANILIDEHREPHITDFGLAKRGVEATLTLDGQMLGTPAYMSPEQARGESHMAGVPSDIYSVGVILFELLTGGLPFSGQPHIILSQTINDEAPSPRTLNPLVPRDLETICLRCLEKDPAKRFATASELADELGRSLRGVPILSRPIGNLRRAIRWCRRKPLAAALVCVGIVSAMLGPIVALREHRLAQEAVASKQETESQKKIATDNERRALRNAYAADMNLVQNALANRNVLLAKRLLEEHLPMPGREDMRGFEWRYLWKRCHHGAVSAMKVDWPIHQLCISDDGRYAAVSDKYSSTAVFDIKLEQKIATSFDETGTMSEGLLFSKGSERLFRINHAGQLFSWSPFEDTAYSLSTDQVLRAITLLPNNAGLATGGDGGIIEIWSDSPDRPIRTWKLPQRHSCPTLAASPDGRTLVSVAVNAVASWQSKLLLYDVETGDVRRQRTFDSTGEACADFSTNGRMIALQSPPGGGAPRLLNAETLQPAQILEPRSDRFTWVAFSPDGNRLAAFASRTSGITLWDVKTGRLLNSTFPHPGITCAAWHSNSTLVTGGTDGYLRTWSIDSPEPRTILESETADLFWHSTNTPDGYTVLAHTSSDDSELWDIKDEYSRYVFPGPHRSGVLIPDGRRMFARSWDFKAVLEYKQETPAPRTVYTSPRDDRVINALAVSWDGRWLSMGERGLTGDKGADFGLILFDVPKDRVHCRFSVEPYCIGPLAFTSDGKSIVALDANGMLRAWDIASQTQIAEILTVSDDRILSIACHPRNSLVAVGDNDGEIGVVDLARSDHVQSFNTYGNAIRQIVFSPDGRTLIAACGNFSTNEGVHGEIHFWDLESGRSIANLGNDLGIPVDVVMTSDGLQMVSTHHGGQLVIWEGAEDVDVTWQRSPR